ncbi:6160_t:CDS:2, partial [Cetraspora pellucida]
MTKKNLGPCSVRDCQINPKQFRGITDYAFKKAKEKGTFGQYSYLEIGKQLCYSYYLEIIELDRHNVKKLPTNNLQDNVITKSLLFGNKIALMTKNAEPLLKEFFDELYDAFIPERQSAYNKKKIGLYLAASGTSCNAINTMHKADMLVCYKTVDNYRKKIVSEYPKNIQNYFIEKLPTSKHLIPLDLRVSKGSLGPKE